MEITRKTANKIVDLLIAKDISDKDARELSNQICDLLEWEQLTWEQILSIQQFPRVNTPLVNCDDKISLKTWEKSKLIPWTKYPTWFVNMEWKFVPTDMTRIGGWTDENWNILPESYQVW